MAEQTPKSNLDWPKFTEFDGFKLVRECLDSARVGALATHSAKGPWSVTIYFTYDQDFNIYFLSHRSTRHMMEIMGDNKVSFSVFMPHDKSNGANIGVQIEGYAAPVPDDQAQDAYAARMRKLTGDPSWIPEKYESFRLQLQGSVFMRLKPQGLYYVNSTLFGGDRKMVPLNMEK